MLPNIFLGETLADSLPTDDLGLLRESSLLPYVDGNTLIILRRGYFDITNNFCAAKLIEYFLNWNLWKLENYGTPWVYQPIKQTRSDLLGEHGSQAIREGIGVLEKLGILEKWDNSENGQDKTWQYKIDTDVLEQLLKQAKFRGKC